MMKNYQERVRNWLIECFGPIILRDKKERTYRFLEEALEVVQAAGCSREDVFSMVDYVYERPTGELAQEIGGTMVCLVGLCEAFEHDMERCGEVELSRCWQNIDKIRAKHHAKTLRTEHSVSPASTSWWTKREGETDEAYAARCRNAEFMAYDPDNPNLPLD